MYENDRAKRDHNNNINQITEYTEMESRRKVDAYARFKRPPYYLQIGDIYGESDTAGED